MNRNSAYPGKAEESSAQENEEPNLVLWVMLPFFHQQWLGGGVSTQSVHCAFQGQGDVYT